MKSDDGYYPLIPKDRPVYFDDKWAMDWVAILNYYKEIFNEELDI